ncbi:DUF6663 family protein [Halobacteriaceae archaeon GCM10025711]
MQQQTTGTYRVLASPRGREELLLIDVEDHDPTYVETGGYDDDLAADVDGLLPGYRVRATLTWSEDGTPRFSDVEVTARTLLEFVDAASNLFEAALDTMQEARREDLGVNSRVTYGTDREPNGAVYTFAKQPGARDLFEEIQSGVLPLEPLVERLHEHDDEPYELFVLRPYDHEFVVVYLVLDKGSVLADTVRDTYGCPRPDEA